MGNSKRIINSLNSLYTALSSRSTAWAMGYALSVPLFHNMGQKTLITLLLLLAFNAMAYAEPCDHYFKCPYEVEGDSRELPFAPQGHVRPGFIWREQSINGNQAALCVRGDRVDTTIFTAAGCLVSTREEVETLLAEPLYAPYMDGEVLKFKDGLEGRPLEMIDPDPQALDRLEAIR